MNNVEVGKVYRHFKGNYYFVENIGYHSETKEPYVIYKPLYQRDDTKTIWIRDEKMFLEKIPKRPDNITGQIHRFELVKDIDTNYLK